MKKIAFIIPYFGKFNNYFDLFLESCACNPTVDFIIFTDDKKRYKYPKNVIVKYTTLEKMKKYIQDKFDFHIVLDNPYKLCDYRPAYGYIFSEYLKKYDFWGYCDTDLIFGNIRHFYTEKILNEYDKIGIYGHASIIKNDKDINSLFKKNARYKSIFSDSNNSSLYGKAFDEMFNDSINNTLINDGYALYTKELQANIYMKSSNFKLTNYDFNKDKYVIESKSRCIFVFDHGNLFRYNMNNKTSEEYLYIHMQSRKMSINTKSHNLYKIIPNSFDDVDVNALQDEKVKHFNLHYFRLRMKNLIVKIKRRIAHE